MKSTFYKTEVIKARLLEISRFNPQLVTCELKKNLLLKLYLDKSHSAKGTPYYYHCCHYTNYQYSCVSGQL